MASPLALHELRVQLPVQRPDGRDLSDIGRNGERVAATPVDAVHHLLRSPAVAAIVAGNQHPVPRQAQSDCPPSAAVPKAPRRGKGELVLVSTLPLPPDTFFVSIWS